MQIFLARLEHFSAQRGRNVRRKWVIPTFRPFLLQCMLMRESLSVLFFCRTPEKTGVWNPKLQKWGYLYVYTSSVPLQGTPSFLGCGYTGLSNLKPNTHRRRRRDETVLSRRCRRCVHEFATTADGFGDANAQRSAAVGRDPVYNTSANGSRLPTGVFTPPTLRDSTVSSRRRRRRVLGLIHAVGGVVYVSTLSAIDTGEHW